MWHYWAPPSSSCQQHRCQVAPAWYILHCRNPWLLHYRTEHALCRSRMHARFRMQGCGTRLQLGWKAETTGGSCISVTCSPSFSWALRVAARGQHGFVTKPWWLSRSGPPQTGSVTRPLPFSLTSANGARGGWLNDAAPERTLRHLLPVIKYALLSYQA